MVFDIKYFILALRTLKYRIHTYWNKTSERQDVNTVYGPIQGVKRFSCLGTAYFSFERIPFAKPPINDLRFADPEPPNPWTETLDCTNEAPKPVQIIEQTAVGNEDCLYLNVFTKNVYPDHPLPVMVWIYGGAFANGSISKESFSPDYFMEKDVILVCIQYRLGPLGFVSFKDPKLNVPGNAALKDQTLGLKWVKDNIANFGGDSENVTLFGESAGGVSCSYQTISEHSKGLFHKAILMSGTALTHWAVCDTFDMTYRLAKLLGYEGIENDAAILGYLRNVEANDLIQGQFKILTDKEKRKRTAYAFGPCIEKYEGRHCMIPQASHLMMRHAWGNNIPIILGGTSDEGLLSYQECKSRGPNIIKELGDFECMIPNDIVPDPNNKTSLELALRLRKIHHDESEFSDDAFKFMDFIKFKSFWHAIHRTVLSRKNYSEKPTYLYRFSFDSPDFNFARFKMCDAGVRGVAHGDDLGYMFRRAGNYVPAKDSQEFQAVENFINILTNFAINGDPNIHGITPEPWKPIHKEDKIHKCLNFSDNLEIINLPESEKLSVWDSIYPKELLI